MEERRRFVRLALRLPMHYTILPSGTSRHAVTKNISTDGLCFLRERMLAPGTTLQAAIRFPDRDQPVHALAEVVWNEPYTLVGKQEHHSAVEIGARFTEIAPQDRDRVTHHISLTMRSPHQIGHGPGDPHG